MTHLTPLLVHLELGEMPQPPKDSIFDSKSNIRYVFITKNLRLFRNAGTKNAFA